MKYGNLFFGRVEERRDIVPKLCLQEYKIQLFFMQSEKKNCCGANNFKFISGKLRPDRLYIKLVYNLFGNTYSLSLKVL